MSHEIPSKRKYELKKRAEDMAGTHRRITEAAIELHGTLGPSRTTLSAVAKRAGVERRTLYRHFPTEADLFTACSTHYFAANPWPDLDAWRAIRDPHQRLERALDELYAYYERTEPMLSNVLRDAELVDFARDAVAPLHAYRDNAAAVPLTDRPARGRTRQLLQAALAHALSFSTWRSLSVNGSERADAIKLTTALVEAAGAPPLPSPVGGFSVHKAHDNQSCAAMRTARTPDDRQRDLSRKPSCSCAAAAEPASGALARRRSPSLRLRAGAARATR